MHNEKGNSQLSNYIIIILPNSSTVAVAVAVAVCGGVQNTVCIYTVNN